MTVRKSHLRDWVAEEIAAQIIEQHSARSKAFRRPACKSPLMWVLFLWHWRGRTPNRYCEASTVAQAPVSFKGGRRCEVSCEIGRAVGRLVAEGRWRGERGATASGRLKGRDRVAVGVGEEWL